MLWKNFSRFIFSLKEDMWQVTTSVVEWEVHVWQLRVSNPVRGNSERERESCEKGNMINKSSSLFFAGLWAKAHLNHGDSGNWIRPTTLTTHMHPSTKLYNNTVFCSVRQTYSIFQDSTLNPTLANVLGRPKNYGTK